MTDISALLEKATEALRLEINNIYTKAAAGKLPEELSKDLVNYIKLLTSLEERQNEALENLNDEELEALAGSASRAD